MSFGLVDFWFPGETARGEELDRRNAELNRKKVERGQMTWEEAKEQEDRFYYPSTQQDYEILSDAGEGAVDGLEAIPSTVKGTLNSVAGWTLGAIPWWLFLIPIGYGLWYIGAFDRLRGILIKK